MIVKINPYYSYKQTPVRANYKNSFCGYVPFEDASKIIKEGNVPKLRKINNFDMVNKDLQTLLHISTDANHFEISEILLSKGLSPNNKDLKGNSPFFKACKKQNYDLVDLYLKNSANVNLIGQNGNTALHYSIGNNKILELLLKNKANPYILNNNGLSVLHASAHNQESLEFLLKKGINVNSIDANEQTLLHIASLEGNLKLADKMICYNAEKDFKDKYGNTPLHYSKNVEMTKFFIAEKTNVNNLNKNNETPLFEFVKNNDYKSIIEVTKGGAKLNISNLQNKTALCYARNNLIRKLLLGLGADSDVPMKNKKTYLHLASEANDLDTLNLFLKYGADPNKLDENKKSPLYYSIDNKTRIALLEYGANPNENFYLHYALSTNNNDFIDALLKANADVNKELPDGKNSLFLCKTVDHIEKLMNKFEKDEDKQFFLNHKDKDENTAMQYFMLNGRKDLAEKLLELNAEVKSKNKFGYTAEELYEKYNKFDDWIK